MVLLRKILPAVLLSSVMATPASNQGTDEIICVDYDDCYPVQFEPTNEYKVIREGQQLPQGLDVRIDWQTGEKSAKLPESGAGKTAKSNEIVEVIEEDKNKVVNYSEEDVEEDFEITAIKNAYGSHSSLDLDESLDILLDPKDKSSLLEALDSLTEHSHNLKDGILITEHIYLQKLLELINGEELDLKELALRIIAQSLRHNQDALKTIQLNVLIPKFLILLTAERNSVLQKRFLGVISSLIQNQDGSQLFIASGGESVLLEQFKYLKEDSKVRSLEILEDLKTTHLSKRSEDDDLELFNVLQTSFQKKEIKSEDALEYIFDKLVEIKKEHNDFKTDPAFLDWLVNLVVSNKLVKRDGTGEIEDDSLHKKLLEARHIVFGNPNALRKALADEL